MVNPTIKHLRKKLKETIAFEKKREEKWGKNWSIYHQEGYIKALETIYRELLI